MFPCTGLAYYMPGVSVSLEGVAANARRHRGRLGGMCEHRPLGFATFHIHMYRATPNPYSPKPETASRTIREGPGCAKYQVGSHIGSSGGTFKEERLYVNFGWCSETRISPNITPPRGSASQDPGPMFWLGGCSCGFLG